MTRREELLALVERVEKGETGYGIDKAIWNVLRAMRIRPIVPRPIRSYATSIDAQAALPAWIMRLELAEDPNLFIAYAVMKVGRSGINLASMGTADTEPAARLAALLRAMAEDAA